MQKKVRLRGIIMGNYICRRCGLKQKGSEEDYKKNRIKCKRCNSGEIWTITSTIKLYYRCNKCDKVFKITELAAIELMKHKGKVPCPSCGDTWTSITTQTEYKKYSGQAKRLHDTQIVSLREYY